MDFHGERRSNATHQSTTDPQARLARKGAGKEAKLSYAGHVQMDNRHGLVVNTRLTQASGTPNPKRPWRWWQDRGLGTGHAGRRQGLRSKGVGAGVARSSRYSARRAKVHSAIDRRTTRHPGYLLSQSDANG